MLILRPPWDSQPQEAVEVDRSNPFGSLVTASINAGAGVPVELVRGDLPTPTGGGPAVEALPAGRGFTGGSSRSANWPRRAAFCDGSLPFSVEVLFTYKGAGSRYHRIFDLANGGASVSGGWDIELGIGGSFINFVVWNGNLPGTQAGSPTLTTGQLCHVVCTFDGATQATYFGGALYGSRAAVMTASNMATARFMSENTIGGQSPTTLAIHMMRFFQGTALNAGQISNLAGNPWQLFAPRRIWVPVSAAAGGGYTLTLDAGAYALSGQSAALGVSRALSAAAGSYAVAGQAAALKASRALSAAAGSYAVAGQAASFKVARVLALAAGSYALSGSAATLTYTSGSATYSLALDAGSYAVSGAATGFRLGRALLPDAGIYTVNGQSVTLSYSGAPGVIATMPPYITAYFWKRTA